MGLLNRSVAAVWNGMKALRRTSERDGRITEHRIVVSRNTLAGVKIDAETALKSATVWACLRYLSQNVGVLPWRVRQLGADGNSSEIQARHPADYVINKRPDPNMGAFSWRESMLVASALRGNAYAEIERDLAGRLVWLHWLEPWRVTPYMTASGILEYEVWNPGAPPTELRADDVFHLRGFGQGPLGQGIVDYAAQSLGWASATELFGAAFFGEGLNPGGVVETPAGLTPKALETLKGEFRKLYQGPQKANRTVFLDAGMKWSKITTAPNEAQFIETRQHQIEEICRWFGVPPHKVMHLLRSTNNNIEHQSLEAVGDSISPWVRRFEEEGDWKLFGQNRGNFFTRMDMSVLLRGDFAARADWYTKMWQMGAFTINEIRAMEGWNPVGPDGDKRAAPQNMTTLAKLGEDPEPAPARQLAGPGTGGDQEEDPAPAARTNGRKLNGRGLPH